MLRFRGTCLEPKPMDELRENLSPRIRRDRTRRVNGPFTGVTTGVKTSSLGLVLGT